MFRWTQQSIEWYQRAVARTSYTRDICEELKKYFQKDEVVLDIGCGLGSMDLLLAPYTGRMTGVDLDPQVIRLFQESIRKAGIRNLTAVCSSWEQFPEKCCDTLLMCSFGVLEDDFDAMASLCRKRMLAVKRNVIPGQELFVTHLGTGGGSFRDEAYLKKRQIRYRTESFEMDFGQPLRDEKEAEEFAAFYTLMDHGETPEEYCRNYVVKSDDPEYPLYLPNPKEVRILEIPIPRSPA